LHLLEWTELRALTTPNAAADVGQQKLSTAAGDAKCCNHFGRQFGGFLQN